MTNDPLKDLFQEAFAKEDIPFDPAAWNQMNALLNQQQRRRFLWIGLGGSGGFTLLTILILFFFNENATIYEPRGDAYKGSETSSTAPSTPEPVQSLSPAQQTAEWIENEESETASFSGALLNEGLTSSTNKASNNDLTESTQSTASNTPDATPDQNQSRALASEAPEDAAMPPAQTADTTSLTTAELPTPWNIPPDVFSSLFSRRDINPINRIVWQAPADPTGTFEDRTLESPAEPQVPSQFYLRIGLSRNFMLKTGQVGGIGYERQLAEHVLLNAELNLTRDYTYFNYVQQRTDHGFDQYNVALRIWASEMIHAELPLMLRFRWNRLTVGSGFTFGLLWSTEVIEESLETSKLSSAHKQPVGDQTSVGYVNWSAARSPQIAVPIDIQYQLDERYAIGGRFQYGLRDAFGVTQITERLHRIECYLKMNLNR